MSVVCDAVTKKYRGVTALNGLTFTLGRGVTGLLGPNGAGKTTLLRLLSTAVCPTSGRVLVDGRDAHGSLTSRTTVRRRLGYLPQEVVFPRGMTVFGFVDYIAVLKEWDHTARRHAEVHRVLELVGLADRAAMKLRALSGGQRRRAALAQAFGCGSRSGRRAGRHRRWSGLAVRKRPSGRSGVVAYRDRPVPPGRGSATARRRAGRAHPRGRLPAAAVVASYGGPILGVVVGRWFRWSGAPLVAAVLLVAATILCSGLIEAIRPYRQVMPWTEWYGGDDGAGADLYYPGNPRWWLLYTICLCAIAVLAAMLHDRELPRHKFGVAVAVLLAMAGWFWLLNTWPSYLWLDAGIATGVVGAGASRLFDEPAAAVVDTLPRALWWRTVARLWSAAALIVAWLVGVSTIDAGQWGVDRGLLRLYGVGAVLTVAAACTGLRRRGHASPGYAVGGGFFLVLLFLNTINPVPSLTPLFPLVTDVEVTASKWVWVAISATAGGALVTSCYEGSLLPSRLKSGRLSLNRSNHHLPTDRETGG